LPQPEKFCGKVYGQQVILHLLEQVRDTDAELPIALAGLSGLRRGEVAGLTWDDVNFDECIITVKKQRTAIGEGDKRSRLKTSSSFGSIRVSNALISILKRHKVIQTEYRKLLGDAYNNTGFVYCESNGSIINPSNISKRFLAVLEKHGFEHIRFHDLRHSFCTNLIRLGVPINTVSKMMGHSSVSITLEIYSHVLEEMQQDAVMKMDADIVTYLEAIDDVPINSDVDNETVKESPGFYRAS
jgi:integrase